MKYFRLSFIIVFLTFWGCAKNRDIIIQEAEENCSCAEEIERVQERKVSKLLANQWRPRAAGDFLSPSPSVSVREIKCDNPFHKEGENKRQYSKTKTFEIFNTSETKVYKVMIQLKNSGKIKYETHMIEPTQNIILGCNFDFDANLDKVYDFETSLDIDKMELTNFGPIEYRIHKVHLISEY